MKRMLVLLCVVAFLIALPMSHAVFAGKAEKVAICHLNSANDVLDLEPFGVIAFGKEVEVSENALDAHLAHGDSTQYLLLTEEVRDLIEARVLDSFDIQLQTTAIGVAAEVVLQPPTTAQRQRRHHDDAHALQLQQSPPHHLEHEHCEQCSLNPPSPEST